MSDERAEQVDDNPAALLRLAAAGRREYAESGGPNTELLLHEASAYEQAAQIVEGDLWALQGALPSWRWMQIPASYTERGLYGTAERGVASKVSRLDGEPTVGMLGLTDEYRHDDCATCGTKADPVILQHPAGYTLAEQVQAVWDEEGPDGIADAIRRVARGEGT